MKNEDLGKNLQNDIWRAKDICFEYNQIRPSNHAAKEAILRELFGKLGKNSWITQPFYCDFGYTIEIGDNFYSNHNLIILDGVLVKIGDNVFIAPNCCLATSGHPEDPEQRSKKIIYVKPITIEDNVWIGAGVTVLGGVTIGKNSIIGAGSVVTKDIPEDVVAVGNPCRVVRPIKKEDKVSPEDQKSPPNL